MYYRFGWSLAVKLTRSAAGAFAMLVHIAIGGERKYHPEQHYMRGPGPKWREKHMFDITTRGA